MTLESHLPTERMNIRRLAIEQPEQQAEFVFDPGKEFTDIEWDAIRDLSHADAERPVIDRCDWLAKIKILNRERFASLDYTDGLWPDIQQSVRSYRARKNFISLSEILGDIRELAPERITELNLDDECWRSAKRTTEHDAEQGEWSLFIKHALYLRRAYPDHFSKLALNNEERRGLEEYIEKVRKKWGGDPPEIMIQLRLLFPHRLHDFKPPVAVLKQQREQFYATKQEGNLELAVIMAWEMKVQLAEKIDYTDHGLELTLPSAKALVHKNADVPAQRKF